MDFFRFDQIGEKIKLVAKYACIVELFILWVFCIYSFINGLDSKSLWFLLIIPAGVIYSFLIWFGNLLLCGFGDLIQTNTEIRNGIANNGDIRNETEVFCPECWKRIGIDDKICPHCGKKIN